MLTVISFAISSKFTIGEAGRLLYDFRIVTHSLLSSLTCGSKERSGVGRFCCHSTVCCAAFLELLVVHSALEIRYALAWSKITSWRQILVKHRRIPTAYNTSSVINWRLAIYTWTSLGYICV
jgi:hypothetical protein